MKTRKITNYSDYEINKEGEVFSNRFKKRKKLKPQKATQSKKYLQVSLYNEECRRSEKDNRPIPKKFYVHRLVWETFKGEIPSNKEIDHKDDDPSNNKLSNLQMITRKRNQNKGSRKKHGEITRDKREYLLELREQGLTYREIADKVGKSLQVVWRVINDLVCYQTKENGKTVSRLKKWVPED